MVVDLLGWKLLKGDDIHMDGCELNSVTWH